MSCRSAARRRSRSAAGAEAERACRSPTAISATRSEWRYVYGDFASITLANASATRSRRSSSASDEAAPSGSSVADGRACVGPERGPERARRSRSEPQRVARARGRTSCRCARARRRRAASRAEGGEEDLDGLGEADDPAEQRDLLAGEPVGVAPPSQCSSSVRIASAVCFGRSSMQRDLGAALAADLHHLLGRPSEPAREHPHEVALAAGVYRRT